MYYTEIGKQYNDFDLDDRIKHLSSGKEAIAKLLEKLKIIETDEVFINSTFGTKYVSSCVTSTIFNYCKPSKVLTQNTRLIFIIHEFGFPNEKIFKLKKIAFEKKIPLVEDCAQSAYSFFKNGKRVGTIGDYSIYSLKKILPSTNGGLLLRAEEPFPYLEDVFEASNIRRTNYKRLTTLLCNKSINPFRNINSNTSPYLFPFLVISSKEKRLQIELEEFDLIYWKNLDIYSLPVHQLLDENFFIKIKEVIQNYNFYDR